MTKESHDDLRRAFIDALARSFNEGVLNLPDDFSEITDAIRYLAMSSADLVHALDEHEAVTQADIAGIGAR